MNELLETIGIILGLGAFYMLLTWVIIMFMLRKRGAPRKP
jgi:hypothetical protein